MQVIKLNAFLQKIDYIRESNHMIHLLKCKINQKLLVNLNNIV